MDLARILYKNYYLKHSSELIIIIINPNFLSCTNREDGFAEAGVLIHRRFKFEILNLNNFGNKKMQICGFKIIIHNISTNLLSIYFAPGHKT